MSADIAVIVPIYNVEEYLLEALESIASQSIFSRTQVILVNDGSTDSSGVIAQKFADGYDNVKLIDQQNGGLGQARNIGLAHADAEFVTFVDSDDVVPQDAFEKLLTAARSYNSDLVIGNMRAFPLEHNWRWSTYFRNIEAATNVDLIEFPELIHGASVCNKLFLLDRVKDLELRFGTDGAFEDAYVSIPYLCQAQTITLIPEDVYLYRQRERGGSIMDSQFTDPKKAWDMLNLIEFIQRIRWSCGEDLGRLLDAFCIWSFQGYLVRAHGLLSEQETADLLTRAHIALLHVEPEVILESASGLRHRIAYYALKASNFDLVSQSFDMKFPIAVDNGEPFVPVKVDGNYRPDLTHLEKCRGWLDYAEIDTERCCLKIVGTVNLSGILYAPDYTGIKGKLFFDGAAGQRLGFPVSFDVRTESKHHGEDKSLFTAQIPLDKLGVGEYQLRLRMTDGNSAFGVKLRGMAGVYKRPLVSRVRGRRYRLVKDWSRKELVNISVSAPSKTQHLRSTLRRVADHEAKGLQRFWLLIRATTRSAKPLIVIGERGDTAQDNGIALFRYMRSHDKYRDSVYYILDKNSDVWSEVSKLGNVVNRGSLQHKTLIMRASHLVCSQDIDAYMFPPKWNRTAIRKVYSFNFPWKRVFLQHGVTMSGVGPALRRGITGLHLLVTVASQETNYLREDCRGYSNEIQMLGFPRYDRLQKTQGKNTILIAPTWRRWLTAPSYSNGIDATPFSEAFAKSHFKQHFDAILRSERLASILEQYNYDLVFYPHYEFKSYYQDYETSSDRIRVHGQGDDVLGDLLATSKVFVTDYSSTHFDAAYAGASVIYTPFDEEEFHERHYGTGWFEAERDGFGPVAKTPAEVIDAIEDAISRGSNRTPKFEERVRSTFNRVDADNCARVASAIWEL